MPTGISYPERVPLIHHAAPAAPEEKLEAGSMNNFPEGRKVLNLPPARIGYGSIKQGDHQYTLLDGSPGGDTASGVSSDNTPTGATLVAARKKKKFVASWFTPSFVVIALVVLVGDTARGCLFPTLWPLVSSLGGDRIMQGYVVSAFSLGR